jgi:nucleotide-binding universal stress UspA family protein
MNAGRPILVVPREFRRLHGGHVVIAWDGSREAARAVKDALPLLRRAGQVTVAAVADDPATAQAQAEAVAGLQAYLGRHGIGAMARMEQSGEAVGPVLLRVTRELGADMIVAGGYGHSRVRELVMGGTTRTLMRRAEVPLFLSH